MIADAKILIVGAGGLGCPAALALAKEGARSLTVADPDRVDPTNLHRQLLHRTSDVGRLKCESMAERLRAAFPMLTVKTEPVRVDETNALSLFSAHDLVLDGTDGVKTKFLLSDAAVRTGTKLIYGGVLRMSGQLMAITPGGPCLRCLFEAPPPDDAIPTCAQAGVLGSMPGVIGGLMALLAKELLAGADVGGQLRAFDGSNLTMREVRVRKRPDCASCSAPSKVTLVPLAEMSCAR